MIRFTRQSSRLMTRAFHASRAAMQAEAAGASGELKLTFALPHQPIYEDSTVSIANKFSFVDLVNLPGVTGTYGITAGHTPNVTQLMPGVVEIFENRSEEPTDKYFVAGGYAFAMPDNTLQIAATEACKLEDIDPAVVQKQLDESQAKMGSATPGSAEHASAQIEVETNTAMAQALGL
eukprot:g2185.t1